MIDPNKVDDTFKAMLNEIENQNILFFDGVCHLCSGYVDFLIRLQTKNIYYAPLQGSTAKKVLPSSDHVNFNSLVYYKNQKTYRKSSAALESLIDAHAVFVFLRLFFIIPKFFRDAIYDLIATNRYKLFGKAEICRLPTPQERQYFLD